jgi:hypothetical protein
MEPDERMWLHHPETGGDFHCPAGAVEHWKALGWVLADQPPETPNPAVAELVAWREAQAAEQQAEEATPAGGAPAPTTKQPRRGASAETPKE